MYTPEIFWRLIHFPSWQILMRDSKGISDDQMKEFRTSFNFFDKVCHAQKGLELAD